MNLTITDLSELPLPAAVFDDEDGIIAKTPEWTGATTGAIAFPVRRNRLVIATGSFHPQCETILAKLLDAIDNASLFVSGEQRLRVSMLAASLRIVAGRQVLTKGTSHDVMEYAKAGISARTSLAVTIDPGSNTPIAAPEVIALVLVQFASNAERHAQATEVFLTQSQHTFSVLWKGALGAKEFTISRQRSGRERWGLGFARIAADTLGGIVYPPYDREDGFVVSTLELGLEQLALPIAAIRQGHIVKASRAWDEETNMLPGYDVNIEPKLLACVRAAYMKQGDIAVTDGWWSRSAGDLVWIAIPPDDILDRARDVLQGIAHERALWDGIPEPARSRVFALDSLLDALLGHPLPRVSGEVWNKHIRELGTAFGLTMEIPEFPGMGAVDPRIVAFLASEFGEKFEIEGENLYLHVRQDMLSDPFVQVFLEPNDNALRLS
ncbi:MAG: hypothetical protein ACP5OR_02000 [Candidatus Dormibacteria bacterium]